MEEIKNQIRKIWLAGGCFWGVEAYFAQIDGVVETNVGYANGRTKNPAYEDIPFSGHAEAVEISYNPNIINLERLLFYFFRIIDPTIKDRQGPDVGTQYRTGIYYRDESDLAVIEKVVANEQEKNHRPIVTEVQPLQNYYPAEEYHQDYLKKNPGGYCHINLSDLPKDELTVDPSQYEKPSSDILKKRLSPAQYSVTQENHTEPPYANEFWENKQKGLYVDIITGEPLFVSTDKYDSGCGWPSFTKPINKEVIVEKSDHNHRMTRTEVRSRVGDSHLGHVFNDGPQETGGLRYCINSASLKFIHFKEMDKEGYGKYIPLIK